MQGSFSPIQDFQPFPGIINAYVHPFLVPDRMSLVNFFQLSNWDSDTIIFNLKNGQIALPP